MYALKHAIDTYKV